MRQPRPVKSDHDTILLILSAAVFLIFFNAYMIAPLIPALAAEFQVSISRMGWVVSAYMLSYGFSTLLYGPLSDRIGRKPVILTLLALFSLATLLVGFSKNYPTLIILRVICGLFAGGVLPITLALMGDLYGYSKLGRPMGWIFGSVAGGMAFGSTLGAWLNPIIGWRSEFFVLGLLNTVTCLLGVYHSGLIRHSAMVKRSFLEIVSGYWAISFSPRGRMIYALVFINGVFHSGVFSWLGYYLIQRHRLGDQGVGAALLGYGVPGMLFGPAIGRIADRYGRRLLIPAGFFVASFCAFFLIPRSPLLVPVILMTILSFGFDMSHPLMAGVIAVLDPPRRGQAMALNAFALFTGFGLGALLFQIALNHGFKFALACFALGQLAAGILAAITFYSEAAVSENDVAVINNLS